MRPLFKNLVKSGQTLQKGCYMVQVDEHGRASVLPISNREQKEFIKSILGRC